ncbi:hypothetical protein [Roseomonas sp. BN140053]|uniref:hypothetical protein n=1 Tax=Roseomonas sp. BN140053 TaxID=3391898 RepID=UPI0039E84862
MQRWRARDGVRMGWGVFLACWALAAIAALTLGRDANWDLRNYHYYNAYALLQGRWDVDLAPAGGHSFLHPGLDLPFYLLTQSSLNHWPRLISVLQAGYLGLLAFLVLAITNLVCHGAPGRLSGCSMLVAAFGLSGAATLPEAGTTFNDIQVGCLVVGALLALLLAPRAEDRGHPRRATVLGLLAGTLAGAAVGLKLTAVIFPPALALAALFAGPPGAVQWLRRLALLAAGGIAGFAAVYGPWAWFLFERFGNPFGPFLNEVFHSPWFLPETLRDTRFLPADLWQALIYPLLWARYSVGRVTEWPVADPRFAVGLLATVIVVGADVWRRLMRPHNTLQNRVDQEEISSERAAARRAAWAVMAFVLVGYALWLITFSILRYAGPLEVLLGVPIWAVARELSTATPLLVRRASCSKMGAGAVRRTRIVPTAYVAVALGACSLGTRYPEWDRQPFDWAGDPRGTMAVAVAPVTLPQGSLVAMVGPTVSFTAPFLSGPGIRFIGAPHPGGAGPAAFRTAMADAVREAARQHRGFAFAVVEDPDDYDREVAQAYGISLDLASCADLPNNLTTLIRLCRWRNAE